MFIEITILSAPILGSLSYVIYKIIKAFYSNEKVKYKVYNIGNVVLFGSYKSIHDNVLQELEYDNLMIEGLPQDRSVIEKNMQMKFLMNYSFNNYNVFNYFYR